jgi:hypothetical protein
MRYTIEGAQPDDVVVLMDSISEIEPGDAHKLIVAGSHCSQNVPRYALSVPLKAVVFNDAGIGKDNAGISSLPVLGEKGLPAATVSHNTARIGDARDVYENGEISVVNGPAEDLGVHPGMTTKQFIDLITSSSPESESATN